MFSYQVETGIFLCNGAVIGKGYSGHGEGLNNSEFERIHDVGPCPRGNFILELIADGEGNPIDYEGKAAPVFRIVPTNGTEMFGRSGMLLHGHKAGEVIGKPLTEQSSLGCIVQEHATRVNVMVATDKRLKVL